MDIKWVTIGEIGRTHGVNGELKIRPHTEFPERFLTMASVDVFERDGKTIVGKFTVDRIRSQNQAFVVKLNKIDSIESAERLRGMLIQVDPKDTMPLPEGRHYIFELIGLQIVTEQGEHWGTVTEVLQTGANDVYVVKPTDPTRRQPILIPVIDDVVRSIDLDQGVITICPMEGLLD